MKKTNNLTRREFTKVSIGAALAAPAFSVALVAAAKSGDLPFRLGGPVPAKDPDSWIGELKSRGYRAAYCPVKEDADDATVKAYVQAAQKADIVISEVGAWRNNPLSDDAKTRAEAIKNIQVKLDLADRVGARCCVNVAGSRGERWAGPHEKNLTDETFDRIVETTRAIVDGVRPKRTYFTLEMMPWCYPDSPDAYVRLLKAIDRERFAVHLDPVNIVTSPQRYYNNGALIRECFKKLGPRLRSCHGKDILLSDKLTTHLDEVRPGLGGLDYKTFIAELSRYPEVPLMLEHLKEQEEYRQAAEHVRSVASRI